MQWVDDPSPAMQRQVVALARIAIEKNPANAGAWHALAETLRKSGEPAQALAVLDQARAAVDEDAGLLLCRTRAAHMLAEFPAALAAAERALVLSPDAQGLRVLRCDILSRMRETASANEALHALAAEDSGGHAFFELKAKQLKTRLAYEPLIAHADAHLARHPGHTSAIFFKVQALLGLGRVAEANALLDFDRFVRISALDNTVGPEARDAIAAEIRRNPTLARDPSGKTTRDGLQTRHLRQPDAPAVEALLQHIRREAEAYAAKLAGDTHPFARACPARARLSAWAVIYSASGRQQVHHHASGWLSGVFYVAAPRVGDGYGGALQLGPLTMTNQKTVVHPGAQEIEPVPGRLVTFPSYMPHATLPPEDDGSRVIVSFDVVPESADPDAAYD